MQLFHFKGSYSPQLSPAQPHLILYAKLYPLIAASCYGDTSLWMLVWSKQMRQ